MTEPLSPAANAINDASYNAWVTRDNPTSIAVAALRAAGLQMIRADDLGDSAEDITRGAERSHQAGWLCRIADELEGQPLPQPPTPPTTEP